MKKGGGKMRFLLKILMTPVILVLVLFVWICSGILYCSAYVFGIASRILGVLALMAFLSGSPDNSINLLFMDFLVSPVGIPMAAARILGWIQDLRYAIQDRVYG